MSHRYYHRHSTREIRQRVANGPTQPSLSHHTSSAREHFSQSTARSHNNESDMRRGTGRRAAVRVCAHPRPSPLSLTLLPPERISACAIWGRSQSTPYEKKHQNLREKLDHMPLDASPAHLAPQTFSSAAAGLLLYPNELELDVVLRA